MKETTSVSRTFVYVNNVWVLHARHYLNLPSYPDQIGFRLYLAFLDRFYRHFLASLLVNTQLNFTVSTLTELLDDVEPKDKRKVTWL